MQKVSKCSWRVALIVTCIGSPKNAWVLLRHNAGFYNGCITKSLSFFFRRKPTSFRKWQKIYFFTFIFYHRAVTKQDHYMTHLLSYVKIKKCRLVVSLGRDGRVLREPEQPGGEPAVPGRGGAVPPPHLRPPLTPHPLSPLPLGPRQALLWGRITGRR